MNRAERRRLMKKVPSYKRVVKNTALEMTNNLEKSLQKYWEQSDESLNYGENEYDEDSDNFEDEIYE